MDVALVIVEELVDQVVLEQDGLVITRVIPSEINYLVRYILYYIDISYLTARASYYVIPVQANISLNMKKFPYCMVSVNIHPSIMLHTRSEKLDGL